LFLHFPFNARAALVAGPRSSSLNTPREQLIYGLLPLVSPSQSARQLVHRARLCLPSAMLSPLPLFPSLSFPLSLSLWDNWSRYGPLPCVLPPRSVPAVAMGAAAGRGQSSDEVHVPLLHVMNESIVLEGSRAAAGPGHIQLPASLQHR
jgi:hypothetical protein